MHVAQERPHLHGRYIYLDGIQAEVETWEAAERTVLRIGIVSKDEYRRSSITGFRRHLLIEGQKGCRNQWACDLGC